MTDSLLEGVPPTNSSMATAPESEEGAAILKPPEGVPEKFWDSERGTLRSDALIKSYKELERKLGATPPQDLPETPDDYLVESPNKLITGDREVNARLHAAGFTQEQAQLVYNLAAEKLLPMVAEVASVFEAERQIERLVKEFGGAERWRQASRQITAWGRATLPEPVFDALATTYEGVVALQGMMTKDEPSLLQDASNDGNVISEKSLREMMRDPRYWNDQDPDYVRKVRDGFRRLFPD